MNTSIEQARVLIRKANRIVAFSGAGISTEAGIPDFRGKGGLWEDQKLMELMSAGGIRPHSVGLFCAFVADAAQYSSRRADRSPPSCRSTRSAGQAFRRRHTKY